MTVENPHGFKLWALMVAARQELDAAALDFIAGRISRADYLYCAHAFLAVERAFMSVNGLAHMPENVVALADAKARRRVTARAPMPF